MSNQSINRHPSGQPTGGQFAQTHRAPSGVALQPQGEGLPDAEDSIRDIAAGKPARSSLERSPEQAARKQVAMVHASCASHQVSREYVAAVLASDARAGADPYQGAFGFVGQDSDWAGGELTRAHHSGMPHDWPEQMAARGPGWHDNCVQRWNRGLDANGLAHLDELGLADDPVAAFAYAGSNVTECARWVQAGKDEPDFGTYLDRNLGPDGIADYVRAGVDLDQVRTAYDRGVELSEHRL